MFVEIPEVVSFEGGWRRPLLTAIDKLNRCRFRNEAVRLVVDFQATRYAFSEGVIALVATLKTCVAQLGAESKLHLRAPKERRIIELIHKLGVFALFDVPKRIKYTKADVSEWGVVSGVEVEGEKYEGAVEDLRRALAERGRPSQEAAESLYVALVEATANSVEHGYGAKGAGVSECAKWWFFWRADATGFFFALCDLGIGIPKSVRSKSSSFLAEVLGASAMSVLSKDGKAIEKAMVLGRSRTKKSYRGRGLPQLLEVIKSLGSGSMRIYSGAGVVRYEADSLATPRVDSEQSSFSGTIVCWHVTL